MDLVLNKLFLNRQMCSLNSTAICILYCSTRYFRDRSVDIFRDNSFEGLAYYNFKFEFQVELT